MIKNSRYPRVSIVNCVSEALEMLKFSSEQLIENAGTDNFDYIIVCWRTTPEVDSYIKELEKKYKLSYPKLKVLRVEHKEVPQIGYVPNLRAMINDGYEIGFRLNEYTGLVNTDMAFYKHWLVNLLKYCNLTKVIGSVTIIPNKVPHYYQADFGTTEYGRFDLKRFIQFCEKIINPEEVIIESQLAKGGNYLYLIGFPNLFSSQMWHKIGPWKLTIEDGIPDVNFFKKAHKKGFKFAISLDSLTYHLGGVERGHSTNRLAPEFSKKMDYDPISFYSRLKLKIRKEYFNLLKKVGIIEKEELI